MPTYQYACTACGEQHEAVQAFTDAPLSECPACQGRLRKVFSAVGVVFKGSGFYKTDSRAAAAKTEGKAGGKDGGKSGGSETSTPAKTDSAPAAKTDSKSSGGSSSSSSSSGGSSSSTSTPVAKSA